MKLLTRDNLHDYQVENVKHQLKNPFSMNWLQMGLGKGLNNSAKVLTLSGWVRNGDLKVGDKIVGQNGKETTVTGVFPKEKQQMYKFIFKDGSSCRCDIDHLWNVITPYDKWVGKGYRTMSTADFLREGIHKKNGDSKYYIPMVEPIQFPERELIIDPYTLGVWLGDGSRGTIATDVEVLLDAGCENPKETDHTGYFSIGSVPGLARQLKDMGLYSLRSWEKYVPEEYLWGSVDQRLALLQGLCDTDGSPIKCGGGLEYSSTSEKLIDAVVYLAQSLGGVAKKSKPRKTKHQGGEGRTSWRVNVKLPPDLTPFRLKRKLDGWIRPTKYPPTRGLVDIQLDGHEESTCIMVDAEDHLYVTEEFIVTHNTICTLTSFVDRQNAGEVQKVLVLGPLRVIQSAWTKEIKQWEHTQHLKATIIHGKNKKERLTRLLNSNSDVYLCNYEAVTWLVEVLFYYYIDRGKPLPFQMVVYDEVSWMKNAQSKRVNGGTRDTKDKYGNPKKVNQRGWREIIPHFQYRVGLTGSPAANGYLDLFGQYLVVDGGQRLGEYITHYKDHYFKSDYTGWSFNLSDENKQLIEARIADITMKMDAKDYLDLPAVKYVNMMVTLPDKARKAYDEVQNELFAALDSGEELELFSKQAVSTKCLQICNGSPYLGQPDDEGPRKHTVVHTAKFDALEEVLESANGQPVLCSYTYKSDAEEIMKRFKSYKPVNLTAARSADTQKIIDRWNEGKIKLMIAHPKSAGHGIDGLQKSGSILVWFGLTWSLEQYEQMNARLDRQGQNNPVSVIRILCEDTLDIAVLDAIINKEASQDGLKKALDRYRRGESKLRPTF